MTRRQPFNQLFLIMAGAALLVTAASIASLYTTAFERHRVRLGELAKSQARLIESIARFEDLESDDNDPLLARERTLQRVAAAYAELGPLADGSEIVLARRDAERIVFLLARRHDSSELPAPIPYDGEWAQPMRLALQGQAGIGVAVDYRGVRVLAAYEPLADLALGLVVKTALNDIRQPFIRAALIAIGSALLVIFVASRLFFHVYRPIQQALDQQAETFRTLAETTTEGIILADTYGRIRFVNAAAEDLFGYRHGELLGQPLQRLMPPEHARAHDSYLRNYLQTGIPRIIGSGRQLTALRKDGSRFPIYLSVGDIDSGDRRMFAGVIVDISEQRDLQREILAISVDEQRRIGQELHDGLGQQLTGLGLLATSLVNKASKPEHQLAMRLAAGLQEAISQVRALSRGLIPVDVDAESLMSSMAKLIDDLRSQCDIHFGLAVREPVDITDNSVALHLYRIVQEALNNAIKHAEASRIDVVMGREGGRGCLTVHDNGNGTLDPEAESSGLGLRIMKHRCALIDADLIIESTYTEGSAVKCLFPLEPNGNQTHESHPDR